MGKASLWAERAHLSLKLGKFRRDFSQISFQGFAVATILAPLAYAASSFGGDAQICKSMVFGESFRVIQANKEKEDDCKKLYALHARFRGLATCYNLAVKELHSHFSERKTMALLHKLEGMTKEMSAIAQKVIALVRD